MRTELLSAALVASITAGCAPWPWIRTDSPPAPASGVQLPPLEEAKELRQDPGADRHLRAAAWLRGALSYLPPAVETPSREARSWLTRASELEPQEGGAGEVARTLLALLASWESEHQAQQEATRATAKAEAGRARLLRKVRTLKHELERLKAIDLAPLPAEDTHE